MQMDLEHCQTVSNNKRQCNLSKRQTLKHTQYFLLYALLFHSFDVLLEKKLLHTAFNKLNREGIEEGYQGRSEKKARETSIHID